MTPVDPVTTEIIRNAFLAAAEDMRSTLWRSAFSPVIYEMKDCSVALFDEQAQLLAQAPGLPFFLGALGEVVQVVIDRVGLAHFHEGDVYILNDPYLTGSHLNDVDILSPVMYQGRVAGFAITRAHWRDLGGKDAAYAVDSTEIYQEGLRLGVVKLADRGQLREDVVDILTRNSRLPTSLKGDMHAQIAACRIGERRCRELLDRFGPATVRNSMAAVFATTEALERSTIAAIPDGVYTAEGYQDNDFLSDDPIPVRVKVVVQGDTMIVDTYGSSRQRVACTNCGLAQTLSAVRLAYKFLIRADLGVTGGSFRPLKIEVERGSIFAAEEPAACLQYGTHTMLLVDLIIRALALALPERVAAGLPGDAWNVIMVQHRPDGGIRAAWGEATAGGWGANAQADGENAVIHSAAGDFRNFPVESMESKFPLRIRRYALGQDSGGPGWQRGGLNVVREYEITGDHVFLSLWFDRTRTPAWGLFGGQAGAVPEVILHPDTAQAQRLLKVNHLPLKAGTVFRVASGGGGGYGSPQDRPVERVMEDLVDGYISREAAEKEYSLPVKMRQWLQVDDQQQAARPRRRRKKSREGWWYDDDDDD
ncbi:MAG: hydantoinase B/oxoprolinase family protein [Anaerolineae bacterium]|nr:hydantoinase B/oxoprolinase family protein [Anaerolineae bacterium]